MTVQYQLDGSALLLALPQPTPKPKQPKASPVLAKLEALKAQAEAAGLMLKPRQHDLDKQWVKWAKQFTARKGKRITL